MSEIIDPNSTRGCNPMEHSVNVKLLQLVELYRPLIARSYEQPFDWYYLVFKPFNDTYDVNKYSICLNKTTDYLRKSKHVGLSISSREILAAKIHVNSLVVSNEDLYDLLHGKTITTKGLKYRVHVECVESYADRLRVLQYIFKEADHRQFALYMDHMSTDSGTIYSTILNECKPEDDGSRDSIDSRGSDDPDEPINLKHRLF